MPGQFPLAAGFRDIGATGMKYIPALYSGKMLKKYYDSTVLAAVTNTDYEGEIKRFGDIVYIRATPTITIRDYTKGMTLVNEQPESTATELPITKGKYWSFVSEDLDKVQTDIKGYIGKWADDGAEQMKITIDTDVLAYMAANPHAENTGTTAGVKSSAFTLGTTAAAVTLTKANVLEYIVDCGTVLDEQNVPDTGRFLVIPPLVAGLIKKSDIKDASLTGDPKSVIRTGLLGMVDRFTLFSSNLLPTGTEGGTNRGCVFGHKDGCTFAAQLTETKVQDNPNGFGMLHRGLMVYGRKVIKPEAAGTMWAKV